MASPPSADSSFDSKSLPCAIDNRAMAPSQFRVPFKTKFFQGILFITENPD